MKVNLKIYRVLFVVLFSLMSVSAFSQQEDIVKKGQPIPFFSFKDEKGQWINSADYQGKVIMVTFFATWCVPCREELPLIEKNIWEKYKNHPDFKLLLFGRGNSVDEVNKMKADNALELPLLTDENKSIYNKFATAIIPRSYIIDSSGTVVYVSSGFEKPDFYKMLSVLNNLLKE